MDDDLRNASLAQSFSSIISNTLYLLFPIWVLRDQIQIVLGKSIPHIYLLLFVPLLAFIFGNLLPFVIGVYRFRSQSRFMLQWEEKLLEELYEATQRPPGSARSAAINEKVQELEQEIRRSFSQNRVMEVYQSLAQGDLNESEQPLLADRQLATPESNASHMALTNSPSSSNKFGDITRVLLGAGDTLRSANPPQNPLELLQNQVLTMLQKYRSHLIDWDMRFNCRFRKIWHSSFRKFWHARR